MGNPKKVNFGPICCFLNTTCTLLLDSKFHQVLIQFRFSLSCTIFSCNETNKKKFRKDRKIKECYSHTLLDGIESELTGNWSSVPMQKNSFTKTYVIISFMRTTCWVGRYSQITEQNFRGDVRIFNMISFICIHLSSYFFRNNFSLSF